VVRETGAGSWVLGSRLRDEISSVLKLEVYWLSQELATTPEELKN